MSNIVEFVLKVKDLLSGGLRGAAANSVGSFNTINSSIAGTQGHLNGLGAAGAGAIGGIGSAASSAAGQVNGLNQSLGGLNQHLDGLAGKKGGFLSDVLTTGLGTVLGDVITKAGESAVDGIKSVLTAGQEAATLRSDFKTQAGDVAGNQLYEGLNKWIADSIYGKEQFGNAQTLLGFGEAVNKVIPDLKMLADVAGSNVEHLQSLSLVFGQTLSAGKLTGGDLQQYIAAGFNPLQELSKMSGKPYSQLRDEMEKGLVSSDMVRGAFEHVTGQGGRFYQRSANEEKTPAGKLGKITGDISTKVQDLGEKTLQAQLRFLTAIEPIVAKLPALFDRLAPGIEKVIDGFTGMLPSLAGFGGALVDDLKPFGELLTSPEFVGLGKAVVDLSKGLLEVAKGPLGEVADLLKGIAGELTPILDGIKDLVGWYKQYNDALTSSREWTKNTVTGAWDWISSKAQGVVDALRGQHEWSVGFGQLGVKKPWWEKGFGAETNGFAGMPKMPAPGSFKDKPSAAAVAASESVVGGGTKTTNINFRSFVEHLEIKAASTREGLTDMEQQLQQILLRLMAGVPG